MHQGKKASHKNTGLKKLFSEVKKRQRLIIISIIVLLLFLAYSKFFIIVIFISLAGISKIYHRFFKSSIGIDLVFFTGIMASLVYSPVLGLIVSWAGLIIADTLGSRFTHTSVMTLFGLTIVALLSKFFALLPIVTAAIMLTIIFEVLMVLLYHFVIGSSPQRIFLFISTHLCFNLLLIMNFAVSLKLIMV
ncbi:hypothetical protein JXC34_00805 [Candidatus Woesearchaeota archaeon]|nr:hypothetical protein [Candidatus Woesearchaeota archaeon]